MPANILFPIVFVVIANVFVSQLVIGVLIDNIRRQTGSALYTEHQRIWRATQITLSRLSIKTKNVPPTNALRSLYIDLPLYVGWVFMVIYVGESGAKIIAYGVLDIQLTLLRRSVEQLRLHSSRLLRLGCRECRVWFTTLTAAIRGTFSLSLVPCCCSFEPQLVMDGLT